MNDLDTSDRLTESEFRERLRELIRAGHVSGVDVGGGYKVTDPSIGMYWGVEIVELAPESERERP